MAKNTMIHDVQQALTKLSAKHKFAFDTTTPSGDLLVRISLNDKEKHTKEMFRELAAIRGIDDTLFGKTVRVKSTTYKVVGINPVSPKKPLLLQVVEGRKNKDKLVPWSASL